MGPDILLYTPPSQTLADDLHDGNIFTVIETLVTNPATLTAAQWAELQEVMSKPFGAAYSTLFRELVVTAWPQLETITTFVAEANTIAENEDTSALSGFFAQWPAVQSALTSLGNSVPGAIQTIAKNVGTLIGVGPWMEDQPASGIGAALLGAADPRACRPYEFLRWHKSGEFARALLDNAKSENQRAFALGWLTHVAASVTGEPFVNNIVGGPYRTHWWRNRLVQNFVDSWVYGRFETTPPASMAGDTPTPAYADWASICAANLQEAFNVGHLPDAAAGAVPSAVQAMASGNLGALPQQFPVEIAQLLTDAIDATYPVDTRPNPAGSLSAQTFADAYVGAFAVFWFLTSGQGPVANNSIGAPPSGCGTTPPSWLTPGSAPAPQQQGITSGDETCEIVLAILAVLAFLTGNAAAGIALLVAALEEQPSINWDEVRCDVYWITYTVYQIENLMRDALVLTALAYPPPILLGGPDVNGNIQPATDFTTLPGDTAPSTLPNNAPPSSGVPLTRTNLISHDRDGGYPRRLDTTVTIADLDFFRYPLPSSVGVEADASQNLIPALKYADHVLNASGLANGGMLNAGGFPSRYAFFGDAVSNARQLIAANGKGLADYNLDADRGYGWQGWHPAPLSNPGSPPVAVLQD